MRSIVFDSGPIISLAMNNLLWILEPLKKKFKGEFFIPTYVKQEVVERPLQTKIFKFEALQVEELIRKGVFKVVYNNEINSLADHLLNLSNNAFEAQGTPVNIIQAGEVQAIAAAVFFDSNAVVIDERITRLMLENPQALENMMANRLHTRLKTNQKNISSFIMHSKGIKVIRSVELVTMAYEMGILDKYIPEDEEGRKMLLDGLLWGVKLKGCSVSNSEIERIMKLEKV